LGLPAGDLRRPYLNMSGYALRAGVEVVKRLGLVAQYGYRLREELIGDDRPENPAPAQTPTGQGACFIR
jgi:hypothetical protein